VSATTNSARNDKGDGQKDEDAALQGKPPLVATSVQVGLAAPIRRPKVQTSVTSRWT